MESVSENLAPWQRSFREGILPQVTRKGLEGLYAALLLDNPRVITGATMSPPPLACCEGEAVEKCCPLCFLLLEGRKPYEVSVGPLEERFAQACLKADELMGEPAEGQRMTPNSPAITVPRQQLADFESAFLTLWITVNTIVSRVEASEDARPLLATLRQQLADSLGSFYQWQTAKWGPPA
jgi:hypothetical protein